MHRLKLETASSRFSTITTVPLSLSDNERPLPQPATLVLLRHRNKNDQICRGTANTHEPRPSRPRARLPCCDSILRPPRPQIEAWTRHRPPSLLRTTTTTLI